ncbi:MAG: hypothetical protein K1X74_10020 [Pirellulales bacterium]|nr:hypothetical protein [Pirellulales bacterium]
MRTSLPRLLVVAGLMLLCTGCAGGSKRFANNGWKFWKRSQPDAAVADADSTSTAPALPTTGAAPTTAVAGGTGYPVTPLQAPVDPAAAAYAATPPAGGAPAYTGMPAYTPAPAYPDPTQAAAAPAGYDQVAMQPQNGYYNSGSAEPWNAATPQPGYAAPAAGYQQPAAPQGMGGVPSPYNTGSQYDMSGALPPAGGVPQASMQPGAYAPVPGAVPNTVYPAGAPQAAPTDPNAWAAQPPVTSAPTEAAPYVPGQTDYQPGTSAGYAPTSAYQAPPAYQTPAVPTSDPNYYPGGTYRPGGTGDVRSLLPPATSTSPMPGGYAPAASGNVAPASYQSAAPMNTIVPLPPTP